MQLLVSLCIRTTAYNPAENGFIEHVHVRRQLKPALKFYPNPTLGCWLSSIDSAQHQNSFEGGPSLHLCKDGGRMALVSIYQVNVFDQTKHSTTANPTTYVVNLKSTMQ